MLKAYKISSNHLISNEFFVNDDFKESKQGYVELEWLSGFIALNFLKKPEVAIKHFSNILDLVTNKNFLSKNYYWYARSLEKLERINEAQDYYKKGSIYISTFYGQLSAERINKNSLNLSEIEDRKYDCKKVNLLENSIINLGKKLLDADRLVLGVRFFKHAAETLLDEERKCLLVFLDRIGNLSGIIAISNKFKIKSDLILKYSFPLLNNLDMNQIDNLQLVYSIIRQESGFYSSAISRTGALGLMQVMPATAKQVASDLGIKYNKKRLSSDEIYNIKIGSFYLNKLLKKFKGSIVLSTAAYNAGPGTINRWLKNYGDPRKFGVDPLIWIEMIPYYETRNYVKRVLSNDLIYRHKLSDSIITFDRARKNFGHKF
jgi:soluble lytic murein transglycosylase